MLLAAQPEGNLLGARLVRNSLGARLSSSGLVNLAPHGAYGEGGLRGGQRRGAGISQGVSLPLPEKASQDSGHLGALSKSQPRETSKHTRP